MGRRGRGNIEEEGKRMLVQPRRFKLTKHTRHFENVTNSLMP